MEPPRQAVPAFAQLADHPWRWRLVAELSGRSGSDYASVRYLVDDVQGEVR
ncbi:hypothetical protein AB0H00_11735 [Nocardia sp. NPDC023852]|uniref:hypothetical protein n=1 Tax=Nocardia sp. NPDC023852 TaxID=3154697 RepID=UPI0034059290